MPGFFKTILFEPPPRKGRAYVVDRMLLPGTTASHKRGAGSNNVLLLKFGITAPATPYFCHFLRYFLFQQLVTNLTLPKRFSLVFLYFRWNGGVVVVLKVQAWIGDGKGETPLGWPEITVTRHFSSRHTVQLSYRITYVTTTVCGNLSFLHSTSPKQLFPTFDRTGRYKHCQT